MKKNYCSGAIIGLLMAGAVTLSAGDALAALKVNVMPSGVTSKTNLWDSGPYSSPGQNLEVWGNVSYDGAGVLSYSWSFGDGSPVAAGPVANRNNIAESHVYSAGSYIATLTVTDGTETDSDTVSIDVVPSTLEVQTNYAIQRGLKYLYMTRTPVTLNGQPSYRWFDTNAISALSVLSFENHGHLATNDSDGDIYADTVKGGLNQVFNVLSGTSATMNNTTYTDSDINGNGRKVYSSNDLYRQSIMAMAVAGSASPLEVVGAAGSAEVAGKTYQVVLEDMIDWIAYAQQEGTSGSAGGWRYSANGGSDNSVAQWPALALGEAGRAPWNIQPPAWVKSRMRIWLDYSQSAGGGFGYTSANYYDNVAKTGGGIAQMAVAGYFGAGNAKLNSAVSFLNTYWGSDGGGWLYHYNLGYHYAMYSVKKGMDFANLTHVGAHDWQEEYNQWYVSHMVNQGTNGGSWNGSYWIGSSYNPTAFALLVMAPLEVCLPVANAGADQDISENSSASLNGSASTHTCSSQSLVSYEWDCDYDGISFTPDRIGATTTCGPYGLPAGVDTKVYTAALRVTDDQAPAKTAIDSVLIEVSNGNVAPVANPGGPYTASVGEVVTLNGSGSTDINACPVGTPGHPECLGDSIVKYEWDIDGDGLYGTDDSPADPVGVTATFSASVANTYPIGLRVTDSFGKTAAQSTNVTTVAVTDLWPVGYQLVSNVYNRVTRKYTVTWQMNLKNHGNGDATNVTAKMTGTSIPVGVTVLDNNVGFTTPDATISAGETQLSTDSFSYSYPRTIGGPDLTTITWDITYTDVNGQQKVVRSIKQ